MQTDVIVIGSGPGGVAAAITCVQAGLRVAIINRKNNAGAKTIYHPCESLHPGVESLINTLGLPAIIQSAAVGKYKEITVDNKSTPLGSDESGDWEGIHISREIFNACLLSAAEEQGILIIDDIVTGLLHNDSRVTGVTTSSGKTLYANFIIDGSGRKRLAGKKLKFSEVMYSPPLTAWSGVSEYTGLPKHSTVFIPEHDGWTWLAPHADNYCTWTCLSFTGHKKLAPPPMLKDCRQVGAIHSANMQWRMFRPLCSEGLLLIGDAAAIIDPAAGQGILNALQTGIYAGRTVASCMHAPSYESIYLARFDQWCVNYYEEKVESLQKLYRLHGIDIK